jgi:hypothetical protein
VTVTRAQREGVRRVTEGMEEGVWAKEEEEVVVVVG